MSGTWQFQPGDTYTCTRCGGGFITDWPHEDAQAEARDAFTEAEMAAPQVIVCDDCYKELMIWYRRQMS